MRGDRVITYSPAYTLVPTYGCFNRCSYCNFRQDLGQSPPLSLEQAGQMLRSLQPTPVTEILILSGEVHPHSPDRPAWFQRLYDLAALALDRGFLPHTNAGPLSFEEMEQLKAVNVSLGLMVEQISPRLQHTVHRHAPSKQPEVRLEQLRWAGQLQIPFTTGLLLGLGESWDDRCQSLAAIAVIHQQWNHIQEVILQPYVPGSQEDWGNTPFAPADLVTLVTLAREILPATIALQIPPNLVSSATLLACLGAGARDLGGIGPKDEVNPDYSHGTLNHLRQLLLSDGWELVPRLPVYPAYLSWLSPQLQDQIDANSRSRQ
ncbi:radical SAM protein [Prochlorothrix hollandica PCC 9006 = CALU 1027]|uniref:7,8-didemethyl-8-hydroxy-5-deazariboflavin synthase n=2 Tax=Prochlorothrix hollandica TaxID=1223 RepID=A0A0M2PYN1_PROHO|nr:radical SAM protein [Prochlorothrix hollandica PCC 9006 = CALU 1027]